MGTIIQIYDGYTLKVVSYPHSTKNEVSSFLTSKGMKRVYSTAILKEAPNRFYKFC